MLYWQTRTLGDQVVIIDEGEIVCQGSNLWLKNNFGKFFILQVMKKEAEQDFNLKLLYEILGSNLKFDKTKANQSELKLTVPLKTKKSQASLVEKLKNLDQNLDNLNIGKYGIRHPNLEEIFINLTFNSFHDFSRNAMLQKLRSVRSQLWTVGSGTDMPVPDEELEATPLHDNKHDLLTNKVIGWELYFQQFQAIFKKKLLISSRDYKSLIYQILLPIVFVTIPLLRINLKLPETWNTNEKVLELTPWLYNDPTAFISGDKNSQFYQQFIQQRNFGNICSKNHQIANSADDPECESDEFDEFLSGIAKSQNSSSSKINFNDCQFYLPSSFSPEEQTYYTLPKSQGFTSSLLIIEILRVTSG